MGIVIELERNVARLVAVAEAAAARVAEIDARRSALAAVQAARQLAAEQRIDRAEIEADKSPVKSLADNLKRFFKTQQIEFEEMPDDLLVALSHRMDEKRAGLVEEAKRAGVAAEAARRELSRAMECSVLAEITLGLARLVPLVTRAADLRKGNAGLWPMGRHPAPVAPTDADAEFRAVIGEALSSGSAWQARTRETLAPFIEEARSAEREVAHA